MNTGVDVRGTRVLIVDDDQDTSELLAELVSSFGFEAHAALSGAQGLAIAAEMNPAIALVDLTMPDMDGYAVAAALRARPSVPLLVALSGYTREEDVARSRAAGFEAHLGKPVDVAGLRQTLFSVTRTARAVAR